MNVNLTFDSRGYISTRGSAEKSHVTDQYFVTLRLFPSTQATMFRTAVRAARPAILAARSSHNAKPTSSLRAIHTTIRASSAHGPAPPQLFGIGGKPGEVPSDVDQATGLERLQLLGDLEGVEVFDESPLDASRLGTKVNPILVPSYVRGFPEFNCVLYTDTTIV